MHGRKGFSVLHKIYFCDTTNRMSKQPLKSPAPEPKRGRGRPRNAEPTIAACYRITPAVRALIAEAADKGDVTQATAIEAGIRLFLQRLESRSAKRP
jgi:hypothetical protein